MTKYKQLSQVQKYVIGQLLKARSIQEAITCANDSEVTLTEVTTTSLKFSLIWSKNTLGGRRTESISGSYISTFEK